MLANEVPNVVSEEGFRLLLGEGYDAQVLCLEDPEKRQTQWHGRWAVRALGGEGRTDCVLVTTRGHRGALQAREFKTSLGLISFLVQMGFEIVSLPMRAGIRVVQTKPAIRNSSDPAMAPTPNH